MDEVETELWKVYEYLEGVISEFDPDEQNVRPDAWDAAFTAYHATCELFVKLGYRHPCEAEPEYSHDEPY